MCLKPLRVLPQPPGHLASPRPLIAGEAGPGLLIPHSTRNSQWTEHGCAPKKADFDFDHGASGEYKGMVCCLAASPPLMPSSSGPASPPQIMCKGAGSCTIPPATSSIVSTTFTASPVSTASTESPASATNLSQRSLTVGLAVGISMAVALLTVLAIGSRRRNSLGRQNKELAQNLLDVEVEVFLLSPSLSFPFLLPPPPKIALLHVCTPFSHPLPSTVTFLHGYRLARRSSP